MHSYRKPIEIARLLVLLIHIKVKGIINYYLIVLKLIY